MNRMSLTKLRWFARKGKPILFICFAMFLSGLQSVHAQITMELSQSGIDTCSTLQLDDCSGSVTESSTLFTDDGSNDGNYADPGRMRNDTVEICPTDKWHHVKVVFTKFDTETGDDLLYVYQGTKKQIREDGLTASQVASGVGVAQAFGGWVYADCDPANNPTGCLTFRFTTDGDNFKGSGWEAWVDCAPRDIEVKEVTINSAKLNCGDDAYTSITIPAPAVTGCGSTIANDGVIARVRNQHGEVCVQEIISATSAGGLSTSFTRQFAIGNYSVVYKLESDTTKTRTQYFSVQAPALVCNDDVNIPLGSACMIVISPDDVLEAPCDTADFQNYMYYNLTITIKGAHGFKDKILRTTGYDNLGRVQYPVITVDDIKETGNTVCNANATINVERVFYADRDKDGNPDLPGGGVIDCDNGTKTSSCSTNISFSDDSQPWITVETTADTLIGCDTTGLARILSAKAIDNCEEDIAVTYSVRLAETDPCFSDNGKPDTTEAIVTFQAVDACGNVGERVETYTFIRPNKQDHIARTRDVFMDCSRSGNNASETPGLKIGTYINGQFQVKDTIRLNTFDYVCGYILTKRDEAIVGTDCGEKEFRYWGLLDWCKPEQGPLPCDTTFIEFVDTIAPVFDAGQGLATDLELGHFSCEYDITKLEKPTATDNCDDNPTVRLDSVFRIEDGRNWGIPASLYTKLDCDSFKLRWIAEDICHEQDKNDTLYQIVVIKDVTKPTAVCVDQLNVSVGDAWGAKLYAEDVDANSWDACGIKLREIRVKGKGEWGPSLNIGCEYVHPNLQIELRITDKKGNQNICWTDINVEDKFPPNCEDLPNEERYCDEFHNGELGTPTDADLDRKFEDAEWADLSENLQELYNNYFGTFNCVDNLDGFQCGELTHEEQYQLIEWPCGEIDIKRRHRSVDWSGNKSNYAYQTVKIVYRANWSITLPNDWEGACNSTVIDPDITINNGACDLLGYEVTSKVFDIPGDACLKMERTYHIINWCTYVAGNAPVELARVEGEHGYAEGFTITNEGNENTGYWIYTQVLKIHDDEAPVVTVVDPEPCIGGVEFDAEPYGEEDQTPGAQPYECDELKTWSATAEDCTNSDEIAWIGKLFNSKTGDLVKQVESNTLSYVVSNKESYFVQFWAYDGCGNSGEGKGEPIAFWDCKKPSPYLLNGIAVELGETGTIQVWATDLDQNTFDNCTDQSKLDLRIWHHTLADAPTTLLGVQNLPKVIELGCLELGTQNVQIYAIDEEGNWDFAQTYILVQDNMFVCSNIEPGNNNMVAGTIINGFGEEVEFVNVAVNGAEQRAMTTGTDGHYQFMLPTGGDYTITPGKDLNPLNGVSTFDLVLISKHILGVTTFESPYQHIAADVNKSGSITAFDMVQLRQLILYITTEFSNNESWRFVEEGYEFTTKQPAGENFSEFVSVNNLATNMEQANFVAVKIGDVNGSSAANQLVGTDARTTVGTLNLNVTDRFVEVGETVSVAFTAADMENATGYQFTLNVAGTATVEEGIAKAANFNTNLAQRGIITTSWNGEATTNDVLFTLNYTANSTGLLSELVSVGSAITTAEAYNTAGELMDVNINFTQEASAGFALNQNTPNPFKGETVIAFNLPQAGTATLKVMDIQGKVLKAISADYAKGANQITLKANELEATGVVYYQLESANNVATKKMIIID